MVAADYMEYIGLIHSNFLYIVRYFFTLIHFPTYHDLLTGLSHLYAIIYLPEEKLLQLPVAAHNCENRSIKEATGLDCIVIVG